MSEQTLTMLREALNIFLFLAVELTVLFLVISYIVGVILELVPAERIKSLLGSTGSRGYMMAALLGSLTPFCSCSTIPMLSGLLKARAGFGPTLTFLFTSPLLNPMIIGLFVFTFGLNATLLYASIALGVSLSASYLLEKFNFAVYIRDELYQRPVTAGCGSSSAGCGEEVSTGKQASCSDERAGSAELCCGEVAGDGTGMLKVAEESRWLRIWWETWQQFVQVLPFLLLGISIGSLTYGFVPTDLIARYAGADNPFAVPVAAVIGVPLYIREETMIPLSGALAAKGMGLGAIMALIIGSAGASLTELILLRSMFRTPMIVAFLCVIFGMALLAGYLFNLLL